MTNGAETRSWRLWRQGRMREAWSASWRITLALVGVVAGCLAFGRNDALMPLLLGVIASGLAETDDNWRGRLAAQATTLISFALVVRAVQLALLHPPLLMLVLALAAFLLTLLGALGDRYRAIAAATLIMSLYAALALQPHAARSLAEDQDVLLLAGAAWHGLLSVASAAVFSRSPVEHSLARLYCVLGTYLELKSKMFEPVRGVDRDRRRLALALHNGRVVEALNATKESLFARMNRAHPPAWLAAALRRFFVAQDVHERASSSHESYDLLADVYFHSDVLYRCQRLLSSLGADCLAIAEALREGAEPATQTRDAATERAVEDLQAAIAYGETARAPDAAVSIDGWRARRALRALATNLSAIDREINSAMRDERQRMPLDTALQDSQPRTLRQFGERLRAATANRSPLLRHAIRLAVALAAGYALVPLTGDQYGYWILLTIVFVCQPRYAATLTRLAERVGGTLLGLLIGWALLTLFPAPLAQAAFVVVAAVLFFAWRASRYLLATTAITVFVLLSFNQVGDGFGLIVPRLLDTLAGSLIAGVSVWLILPSWHAQRLHALAADALRCQSRYLREIMTQYGEAGKHDHLAYRIARRNAHNADAALSAALTAAFREPRYVRQKVEPATRFLVLSHTLLNYLSALGAHRGARLAQDDATNAAAACLGVTLENLAVLLEAGAGDGESRAADEASACRALAVADDDEAEFHRLVRAQLILALDLLPALRAAADELAQ